MGLPVPSSYPHTSGGPSTLRSWRRCTRRGQRRSGITGRRTRRMRGLYRRARAASICTRWRQCTVASPMRSSNALLCSSRSLSPRGRRDGTIRTSFPRWRLRMADGKPSSRARRRLMTRRLRYGQTTLCRGSVASTTTRSRWYPKAKTGKHVPRVLRFAG